MSDIKSKLKDLASEERPNISDKLPLTQNEIDLFNRESLENLKQDRHLRKRYAERLFWMIAIWLFLILTIVIFQGLRIINLSDATLITLITTTTANVTAYFLVVTKYLFPNK